MLQKPRAVSWGKYFSNVLSCVTILTECRTQTDLGEPKLFGSLISNESSGRNSAMTTMEKSALHIVSKVLNFIQLVADGRTLGKWTLVVHAAQLAYYHELGVPSKLRASHII